MGALSETEKLKMRRKLRSLGVTFGLNPPNQPVDLEQTILDSLKYYWTYNTFFFFSWSILKHRLIGLVNVERLIAMADGLPNDELVLLLALSRKMIGSGDERYKAVLKTFEHKGLVMESAPEEEQGEYLIERWGIEESLEPYGVKVRSFYEELPKKFYNMHGILEDNEWLKVRSQFGPNAKADVAYLKVSGRAKSASGAAKIAKCSIMEAKRYWKEFEKVKTFEALAKVV